MAAFGVTVNTDGTPFTVGSAGVHAAAVTDRAGRLGRNYFSAAGALPGEVPVPRLGSNSLQGDLPFTVADSLTSAIAEIRAAVSQLGRVGPISAIWSSRTRATSSPCRRNSYNVGYCVPPAQHRILRARRTTSATACVPHKGRFA